MDVGRCVDEDGSKCIQSCAVQCSHLLNDDTARYGVQVYVAFL
jgi:hypothetical protein